MINLPIELTISEVDEYLREIQPVINENSLITIDDSKLERIDTIGVQFILAVITYILAQGKELSWQSTSKIFQDSVQQLGINDTILKKYLT